MTEVPYPSKSQCQKWCFGKKKVLAVPTTQTEYQCMILTAGQGNLEKGHRTPLWTGMVINGQNKLTGIVNGTNHTDIGVFGRGAVGQFKRPNIPLVFWIRVFFGELVAATNVYFHNAFYVSAEDTFLDNYNPHWKQMHCMCQGKSKIDACALSIFTRRASPPRLDPHRCQVSSLF